MIVASSVLGFNYLSRFLSKKDAERQVIVATQGEEKATFDFLKASINVYYVSKGKYPHQISDMQEVLETSKQGSYAHLEIAISKLKNFKYELRGDGKVYRISYINQTGQTNSVEGSYTTEFHNYDK